jgi:hypothetical protein
VKRIARAKDSSLNVEKAQNALKNKPLPVAQALSRLRNEMPDLEFKNKFNEIKGK